MIRVAIGLVRDKKAIRWRQTNLANKNTYWEDYPAKLYAKLNNRPLCVHSAALRAVFFHAKMTGMNPVRNYPCFITHIFYKAEKITVGTRGLRKTSGSAFVSTNREKVRGQKAADRLFWRIMKRAEMSKTHGRENYYLKSGRGKRYLKSRLKRFLFRTG